MAKGKKNSNSSGEEIFDLRHPQSSRLNIPPAGLVARGNIEKEKQIEYDYNPHLPPVLRFDDTGKPDRITELIRASQDRKLTAEEVSYLEAAFNNHQPWLEWTGKKEQHKCVVDPVALNIHERISAQAIISAARREDIQRDIFADPDMDYSKAIQFYKHPMGWSNRLILGDSLSVMASLSKREALAGQIQMIYMDPPYGISYNSNFQPSIMSTNVSSSESDLTREVEMIRAYRDTWTLGLHTYLSYLRDRFLLCRDLLTNTGSLFVQINDNNEHNVRKLLDEVFGSTNFVAMIPFRKKLMPLGAKTVENMCDYILWFAKDISVIRYKHLFIKSSPMQAYWRFIETSERLRSKISSTEKLDIGHDDRLYTTVSQLAPSFSQNSVYGFEFEGRMFTPPHGQCWVTTNDKMTRLMQARRLQVDGELPRYVLFHDDFPYTKLTNPWMDTAGANNKRYVVQTSENVIERCMLMSSDPGDIVLDPTCGSGSTAFVAEKWGRRWITIDISRVSIAIARQRLLTSIFPFYKLRPTNAKDAQENPQGVWLSDPQGIFEGGCTFDCKSVPRITLKTIAQNPALDPIFEKWGAILEEKLGTINKVLRILSKSELSASLFAKYNQLIKNTKKKDICLEDYRRLVLPPYLKRDYDTVSNDYDGWYEWEIPNTYDELYPDDLITAIEEYYFIKRKRQDEIDSCINARSDQEELIDQPLIDNRLIRVSGPFTVEGVIPLENSINDSDSTNNDTSEALDSFEDNCVNEIDSESQNSESFMEYIINLLKGNGIHLNKDVQYIFNNLEKQCDGTSLHATGSWQIEERERIVALTIGPQYGAMNTLMVEESIRLAARRGFDDLVFAAFSFEGAAQAIIQQDQDPNLRIHLAHISPDVNMGDLLKNTQAKSLFTITGSPRVSIHSSTDESYIVKMEGVDIYDPITNSILPTVANKVAAWFLDSDYDGKCFCICQAFFPDKEAWGKIRKALKDSIKSEEFMKFSGTESIPFKAGKYKTIAVKVIDPRGNEVIRIERLV